MAEKEKKQVGCMHGMWIGWIRICRKINDFIENLFELHTRFITSHHKLVILLCIVFTGIMAIGAVRFDAIQRNEELFIPKASQAWDDLDKGEKYFSLKYRVEEFIIKLNSGGNIFDNNKVFLKALELHEKILKISKFKTSCLRKNATECLFISSLEVFNYDVNLIKAANNSTKIKSAFDRYLQDDTLLLSNGRPASINFQNILGQYNANKTNVFSSNAFRMTYYVQYADLKDDIYGTLNGMEDNYISLCKDEAEAFKDNGVGVELFYFAARTRDDSILQSTIGDLPLFSVAFVLMVAFCLVVFLRIKNPVQGHLVVGIAGICVIMLGVGCGFGLSMLTGTEFVAFTGILMFLILGIGMDNMFIIVDAVQSVDPDIQGPERIVIAMKHVGGSITMTTTTDLVAFAVSTVSDFPAVHLFCIYASLSIFFAYFMLITLFLALLTMDVNRMEAGKRDVCPCCKVDDFDPSVNVWKSDDEVLTKKILRKWGEIIMTIPMKVVIFIAACGLLAAGVYGTWNVGQSFEWKKAAPDGSYFREFAAARDDNFPAGYGVSVIIPPGVDYTSNITQQAVKALDQIAIENTRFENQTINWMTAYLAWSQAPANKQYFDFNTNITRFLLEYPIFKADIVYNDALKMVNYSRVIFFYENNNHAPNQAEAMRTIRKDLEEKSNLTGVFPISIMFIYSEMFAAVKGDTIRNLIICAITILFITLPYLTHPGITTLVFLSFVSLLFELVGLMTAWDVSLDVIAMIIIIMAIGFSVDYTCHIAHAYMISQKETPEKRVIDALVTMGSSVLNGGISTFLGMLITAFSQAEGFRIFFKMVFGIVVLGLLHGLVFLPVLLSIFIRRDLREDMKEFVDEHERKERKKSQRRFDQLSEGEKRKQSIHYRRSSSVEAPGNKENPGFIVDKTIAEEQENVELKGFKKINGTKMESSSNGVNGHSNPGVNNDEHTVHYEAQ